jgi:hypothetical protein
MKRKNPRPLAYCIRALSLAFVVLLIQHPLLQGQAQAVQAQAPNTPNLSGIWERDLTAIGCTPDGFTCPWDITTLPINARAKGFAAAWDEAAGPKYDCAPATTPNINHDPYRVQVEQLPDRVVFTYEKDDVIRTVWLAGQNHPEPKRNEFKVQGYYIGRYETKNFTFDPHGLEDQVPLPSSTQKKVTERYWRDDKGLHAEVTTEDPIFLLEPVHYTWHWKTTTGPLLPYNCDPEIARQPLQFLPSKYQGGDWIRVLTPAAP